MPIETFFQVIYFCIHWELESSRFRKPQSEIGGLFEIWWGIICLPYKSSTATPTGWKCLATTHTLSWVYVYSLFVVVFLNIRVCCCCCFLLLAFNKIHFFDIKSFEFFSIFRCKRTSVFEHFWSRRGYLLQLQLFHCCVCWYNEFDWQHFHPYTDFFLCYPEIVLRDFFSD